MDHTTPLLPHAVVCSLQQPASLAVPNRSMGGMTDYSRARDLILVERLLRRLPADRVHVLARDVLTSLGQRNAALPDAPVPDDEATLEEVAELAHALMSDDPETSLTHVAGLFDSGLSMEAVYLHHLAPAARLLGEWWDANRVSLVDVTIAAGRVFAVMRQYRRLYQDPHIKQRSALFAAVPGEQHRLGVQMAADLFAERGWRVRVVHEDRHAPLLTAINADRSPVIGLSASGMASLDPLIRLVIALRVARPTARIILGGMIVNLQLRALRRLELDGLVGDMASAEAVIARLESMVPANA